MKKKKDHATNAASLRQKAEERLKKQQSKTASVSSEADKLKLIYELEVHQIELEMQNEELVIAKEKAELAEEKYTALYDFAPCGYLSLSNEGVITEINFAAAKMLGKERLHLIKNKFDLFIPVKTRSVFNLFLEKVFTSKVKQTCEGTIATKENSPIYVIISGVVSQNDENCFLTLIDITERKLAEKEKLLKEKLEKDIAVAEESLRFKQNFLANMSHEIRTPLTGILGMADILAKTKLDADQTDFLSIIQQSGENLHEIINNVLDFSKIEAGKMQLKYKVFELESILANAKSLFKSICKKPITFEFSFQPALPKYIKADKNRITQVINNLICNAVKFTEKGKITLRAELNHRNIKTETVEIKILVSDTGKGIPKETKENLFEPFSQVDDGDTRQFEGTGLGLSICKELVHLHEGKIGVDSKPNQGSTFWFTFLADEEKPENTDIHKKDSKTDKAENLKILLAEDKLVNQKVIAISLKSLGHQVTIAENGKKVLEKFEPGKFDLILMDIQMPEMDGITATRKLKEAYSKLPPIVGFSANAFEGDREKYMEKGLDEYLTKPFKVKDFLEVMDKLF